MVVKYSFDAWDGRKFYRALGKGVTKSLDATAKAARVDVARRIPMRITPQGDAQQSNKQTTQASKQKRLGHDIPLQGDKGLLIKPSKYRIERKSNRDFGERVIRPPADRERVIGHLRAKGYRLFEISPEIRIFMGDAIQAEINGLRARMNEFVKPAQ